MHPSAPPYDDSHDYAPPSPFPYFAASPSPSRSHKHNPNPPYSTAYGYPYPYGHHLGPGSSLPPIYIDSFEVNINLGEPSAAGRYGSGDGGYGEGGSELGSDLHGTGDGGSRDGVYFADPGSKKLVLKLDICDDKAKRKVIQTVSKLAGIDAISVDMNEKKLTVIGDVDLVTLVKKLRKLCHTETISVGPVKEPEKKKDEPKKDEGNKDEEPKKDGWKKGEEPKKDGGRKDEQEEEMKGMAELVRAYKAYSPQMSQYYYVPSAEEDPKGCVIC